MYPESKKIFKESPEITEDNPIFDPELNIVIIRNTKITTEFNNE